MQMKNTLLPLLVSMEVSWKVVISTTKRVKIGPKTCDYIFIGYAQDCNPYRFLVQESEIPNRHKNTIMESRNALFWVSCQNGCTYTKKGENRSENC